MNKIDASKMAENVQLMRLTNGLPVLLYPRPDMLTASVGFLVQVGALNEDPKVAGIAHVIEHMQFKSTPNRTTTEIMSKFAELGAVANAHTGWDHTLFFARMPFPNLHDTIAVFADMLKHPQYLDEEFKTEKGAILSEIKRCKDEHERSTMEHAQGELFRGAKRFSGSVIGTEETVTNLTRDDLFKFHTEKYHANNYVICVVGRFDERQLMDQLQKEFGDLKCLQTETFNLVPVNGRAGDIFNQEMEQVHFDQVQSAFMDQYSRAATVLELLMHIYGSGMQSRLFREIREKRGLAYHACGIIDWTGLGRGLDQLACCHTFIGTDAKKIDQTVQLVQTIQTGLCEHEVPENELTEAANHLVGTMMAEHDNNQQLMMHAIIDYGQTGKVYNVFPMIEQLNSVTAPEILKTAQYLFRTSSSFKTISRKA